MNYEECSAAFKFVDEAVHLVQKVIAVETRRREKPKKEEPVKEVSVEGKHDTAGGPEEGEAKPNEPARSGSFGDEWFRSGVHPSRVVVGGFGDGGGIALLAALRAKSKIAGIINYNHE
jgi:hypothetical protein